MAVCYDGRKMDNLLSTQLGGGFHLHVSNTQLLRRLLVGGFHLHVTNTRLLQCYMGLCVEAASLSKAWPKQLHTRSLGKAAQQCVALPGPMMASGLQAP